MGIYLLDRISHVDHKIPAEDCRMTVIGWTKRDDVGIMARIASISDPKSSELYNFLEHQGSVPLKMRPVPQKS